MADETTDPSVAKMRELVAAGIIPADLLQQQAELLERLRHSRLPATEPGQESGSETLIRMRYEERC